MSGYASSTSLPVILYVLNVALRMRFTPVFQSMCYWSTYDQLSTLDLYFVFFEHFLKVPPRVSFNSDYTPCPYVADHSTYNRIGGVGVCS